MSHVYTVSFREYIDVRGGPMTPRWQWVWWAF